jgi:peptide/nickel transport system substrate-binding protein
MKGVIIALAMLTGAGSYAKPTNEELIIGTTQEFETMNPLIMTMSASTYISRMVTRPLAIINAKWEWACELCVTIPSLENGLAKKVTEGGKEKMLVQWELKKGIKWGDGQPVTAKDFKLAWEVGKAPNVSVGSREAYDRIEDIMLDPKDPLKFTTKFKEPRYDFYQISIEPLPSHIEAPIWAKTKGQTGAYEKQTAYTTQPLNPGIYLGPYVIKELKLGSHVILTPNPHFYGKKPAIKKIVIKLIPNTQTLEANLMSGTIHMISELGMTFDQAIAFEKRIAKDSKLKEQFAVQFRDGLIYEHIDLNLRNPFLQDKKVRQALVYSIDRDKLTKALFEGRQKKALSNTHPLDPYFTSDVPKYNYDLAKASKLLDEAGWKMRNDGYRYNAKGEKLHFQIMTTAANKTRELVEVFLQGEWKKTGIDISIKNEPARVFFGETVRTASYPAMAMYAWTSSPDAPPRSTLHSAEIPSKENGWAGQNSGGWSNKEVDDLLVKIFTEFDFAKRKQMMARIQHLYVEEVPVIPLYYRAELVILPTNLKNMEMTGHQFYSTQRVEDWELTGSTPSH